MKFASIEIENFLAITSATVSLEDRGLVLIQGVNHDDTSADSNGSGKSSLADALCWCLYGTTARGVAGDEVVNDKAGKGTRVCVVVDDGRERYWIERHRKHKKHKNSLRVLTVNGAGDDIDLTKGTDKLTQDVVNKIVGASLDVFKSAVYAGQEQMPDLPAMTDKYLKMLIEEAAGVTALEEAYKIARERVSKARDAVIEVQTALGRNDDQARFIGAEISIAETRKAEWLEEQRRRIAEGKTEVSSLVAQVKDLDVKIAKIDEEKIRGAIGKCDTKIAAVGDEAKELSRLAGLVSKNKSDQDAHHRVINRLIMQLNDAETALENVDHKVGCPCDECGREMTAEEVAPARAAAAGRVEKLDSEIKAFQRDLDSDISASETLVSARDAYRASMTDTTEISATRAKLQAALDNLNTLVRQREVLATKARTTGDNLKVLAAGTNPHVKSLETLTAKLTRVREDAASLTENLSQANQRLAIQEAAAKVFSPAGVRAHILDDVTPFLNERTAKYLAVMSDGNIQGTWTTLVKNGKGELREKFSIEVVNERGANSFAGLSGGEKRKVRISTALALQDLVATRASKPIDLFIGDEIDDALDQAGLERLTQILEDKARERGSVFVISHNNLRDWVSQIITVEKRDGATTVIETTS